MKSKNANIAGLRLNRPKTLMPVPANIRDAIYGLQIDALKFAALYRRVCISGEEGVWEPFGLTR